MSRILFAVGIALALAEDPKRPDMKEWKAKQAAKAAKEDAKAAKEAKMAAVNKVVSMLEELKEEILAEGEKEAATYNKFACFCKDTTAEKTDAIESGRDKKTDLTATIEKLTDKRDKLDKAIGKLTDDIKGLEKEMKEAKEDRAKELKVYKSNEADLAAALEALEGAIKVMKQSKGPSLIELKSVAKTVREAAMLADALSINTAAQHKVAFLQEAPEVNMEDYKFHSNDIIDTLEKLQGAFRKEKNEVDAEEVKAVQAHNLLMQEKTDMLKSKNAELDATKKEKSETKEMIAQNSQELTTVAATLLDDQQYLAKLAEMCTNTAKTWDQRSKVRADELSTLVSAIAIVKDSVAKKTSAKTARLVQQGASVRLAEAAAHSPEALEAIEADAEVADEAAGTPVTFLQQLVSKPVTNAKTSFLATRASASPAGNEAAEAVVTLLRDKGEQLKSTLLTSLANHISADPFAKIKQLIQELIERLLTEAANEANQKGWCDKASADAKQKREHTATEIEELNGKMAELEADIGELTEELAVLKDEIAELKDKRKEAEKLRKEEKEENEATLLEANAGLDAVKMAIDVLDKFYKTVDDAKVDLSLAQQPADEAPDAGFDIGEAYTGAQGAATGIIGMLDVIKSDFERTIKETQKEESEAEKEHLEFMTKTGVSLAEKTMAQEQKKKYKDDAEEQLEDATESLKDNSKILSKAIEELLDLKPVCVDTGMSYEERVARRQDEITALNKALCILNAYAEYGPDGAKEC